MSQIAYTIVRLVLLGWLAVLQTGNETQSPAEPLPEDPQPSAPAAEIDDPANAIDLYKFRDYLASEGRAPGQWREQVPEPEKSTTAWLADGFREWLSARGVSDRIAELIL